MNLSEEPLASPIMFDVLLAICCTSRKYAFAYASERIYSLHFRKYKHRVKLNYTHATQSRSVKICVQEILNVPMGAERRKEIVKRNMARMAPSCNVLTV